MKLEKISILGAGAWGTALAINAQAAGRDVKIWARENHIAESLLAGSGNPDFLPGVPMSPINATSDISALKHSDAILAVVPAQFMRMTLQRLAPHLEAETPVILCSKGIERDSLKLMNNVAAECLPEARLAVLSGPSFASDVAKGLPTAITIACKDEVMGTAISKAIGQPHFRPYWSDDMMGTEIGGAVKNVLAIACGISEGLCLGKSAHAALMTRGFAEMTRLGLSLGARPETLAGLCGLGDLVLTCSSIQSRNMSFGKALGEGQSVQDILASRKAVTEGVATAPALIALAEKQKVDMPICSTVAQILSETLSVKEGIETLLARPFKAEHV